MQLGSGIAVFLWLAIEFVQEDNCSLEAESWVLLRMWQEEAPSDFSLSVYIFLWSVQISREVAWILPWATILPRRWKINICKYKQWTVNPKLRATENFLLVVFIFSLASFFNVLFCPTWLDEECNKLYFKWCSDKNVVWKYSFIVFPWNQNRKRSRSWPKYVNHSHMKYLVYHKPNAGCGTGNLI